MPLIFKLANNLTINNKIYEIEYISLFFFYYYNIF